MAYYVDSDITYGAAVTATAMNLPAHVANDILAVWVVVNINTTPTITTGTGWAAFTADTLNVSNSSYFTWKRATSSAEVLSLTIADDYTCGIHCIRDVDQTTAIDAISTAGQGGSVSNPFNAFVQTTTPDCLVLYLMSVGGIAVAQHVYPGIHHINSFDTGGTTDATTTGQGAAWLIQRGTGATITPQWIASAVGVSTRATIAFRNAPGGRIPAYIDRSNNPAIPVHHGFNIGTLNETVVATALTNTAAVNGKTVSYVAAALQADLGIVPFSNGLSKAAAISARTVLTGFEITLTGGRNWSTGLLMGSFIGATPKMGTFGAGSVGQGGCVIRIGSSPTAWCAYQVAAKDSVPTLEVRSVWAIAPGYTGSSYGTPGAAVANAAVTYLQVLSNEPSFASNMPLSEVYQVFTQIVAGGTANFPVDTDGMATVGRSFRLPVIQKSGGFGLLSYAPIQIGGGDAVNFQIDAGSLQFPRRYDFAKKEISFHAPDNAVGISYAGKLGDVIRHTNSVVTSPTPYYFNINAVATSAATWDFSGLVVVGANVTLRPVTTFDSMSFSGCPTLNFSACTVNASAISNVSLANDSLVTTSTTVVSNTNINVTKITAGNRFCSVVNPNIFSSCTFTGSGTSGHAIRITTPGTYSLINLTFTAFGGTSGSNAVANSGSTSAAIFNDSGGVVTLNLSGNGTSPSVRNGVGATTSVVSSATLTLSGLPVGTDIVFLDAGTNTVLLSIDNNLTTSYAYTYSGTPTIDIGFLKTGYVPFYIRGLTLTLSNSSIPVSLTPDRNFV